MMIRAAWAWVGLTALLGAGSVIATKSGTPLALDWQPGLGLAEPWRAFSAVFVHYSALHLGANLAGAALVAALGPAAQVRWHDVLAWLAAWPLTQFGLWSQPALGHYGGLSGVLHAGVAVTALHLIATGRGGRRAVGAALLAGLVAKVLGEAPWGAPLRHPPAWDIAVAPMAHASGLVAGLACGAAARWIARRNEPGSRPAPRR